MSGAIPDATGPSNLFVKHPGTDVSGFGNLFAAAG